MKRWGIQILIWLLFCGHCKFLFLSYFFILICFCCFFSSMQLDYRGIASNFIGIIAFSATKHRVPLTISIPLPKFSFQSV